MGLDVVEVVMAIEEEFDICILDEEAERVRTVGDMVNLVLAKLGLDRDPACASQRAFHLVRREGMVLLHLPRKAFKPETRLSEVFPFWSRPYLWRLLGKRVESAGWPSLVHSGRTLLIGFLCTAAALYAYSSGLRSATTGDAFFRFLLCLVGGVACVPLIAILPLRFSFPSYVETVGGLSKYIVASNAEKFSPSAPANPVDREQIYERLRRVIKEQLAVKDFDENSSFVDDLGLN